jgi:hypothetical protein
VTNPATTTCPGLAFGNVPFAAGSVTQDVVIANSAPAGSANLVISTAVVTSGGTDFSVNTSGIPASVPPGASVNIPVTFDPTVAGPRTGTVRFTTNDPTRPTIDVCLTGTGT